MYDGFGNVLPGRRTGTTPTPFHYAGKHQYYTDESGLLLLGHRYYDPGIGRFISQDPAQDEWNWYRYADKNPLSKVVPDGQSPGDIIGRPASPQAPEGFDPQPEGATRVATPFWHVPITSLLLRRREF